jgi:hypothetical protein
VSIDTVNGYCNTYTPVLLPIASLDTSSSIFNRFAMLVRQSQLLVVCLALSVLTDSNEVIPKTPVLNSNCSPHHFDSIWSGSLKYE